MLFTLGWWLFNLQKLVKDGLIHVPDGFILVHNSPKVTSSTNNYSKCELESRLAFVPGGNTTILGNQTICPLAMHFDGTPHFHMHNHYGYL